MPHRFTRLLLILFVFASGAPDAAELGFAHYAPGAGPVLLQVDSQTPHVLAYKDYDRVSGHAAGRRHLRATLADGDVIAEGMLELSANDRYVVILAGNGTDLAPFQLRVAADHNHVFVSGESSLQTANLAIVQSLGEPAALHPLHTGSVCNGVDRSTGAEAFGHGTRTLAGSSADFEVSVVADRPACMHYALDPSSDAITLAETTIVAEPGERLRRFLIGDGVQAPFEMIVMSQGFEPVMDVMQADGSIEGLWSIAGEPNTGLQVAFDGEAPEGERISAVYFGFEPNGRAAWRTIQNMRLIEYVGGSADGTRAAIGFERAHAVITPHSCMEMSMLVFSPDDLLSRRLFAAAPRNTLRLRRLFPPTCPPSMPNGQEEKP